MATRGSTRGFNQGGQVSHYNTGLNAARGRGGLWKSCPLLEYVNDPTIGVYLNESWQTYDATATTGDYLLTQATQGTGAIDSADSGVLLLDSNSATQGQGANLQRIKSAFVPVAGTEIWAEFEFKIVDTYDKVELFVGLSELDTTLIATQANSSANHIGWQCVTNDGILLFTSEKATAGTTSACATIAEATYIKLGFYVNGVTSVQQYVNGVATGTAHATANVPIVALYPSFVCQTGGTNDPIMHIRGYRVFQTRA